MRMIGIISCHDSLVQDGLLADVAAIGTVRADWRAVRQKEQIGIGSHLVSAFRALEAVDVEERLPTEGDYE